MPYFIRGDRSGVKRARITYGAVPLVSAVASAALIIPARRALAVDPQVALHAE